MTTLIAPLKVEDQDFLVAAAIERCPKIMMARELVKNALEAAVLAPPEHRRVEVRAVKVAGQTKLGLWNTGPGMDAFELAHMTNMAASIRKHKGLNENFGMGAKVAALPSNQRGMRYRSCKDGTVHQVTIAKRDGVYGRLRHEVAPDDFEEVLDVTDAAKRENDPLDCDWTEVVLLGNRDDQNTVLDPFNGDPSSPRQWLADTLYHRFYRMPLDVQFVLGEGTHKRDGRIFKTLSQRIAEEEICKRSETVRTKDGLAIHYVYDEPSGSTGHTPSFSGALQTDMSLCAIVYRDEMYDVRKGRGWTKDAPLFGITFGGKHISVLIELPDDYAVLPEAYRQFLRYTTGPQDQVQAPDFAARVRRHRPQWLLKIIRHFAPDSADTGEIRAELQKLLNELRIRRAGPRLVNGGAADAERRSGGPGMTAERSQSGRAGPKSHRQPRPAELTALPAGARRARIYENTERAPEIIELRTPEQVAAHTLEGRAARYMLHINRLFVNLLYPATDEMRGVLEDEYADVPDQEALQTLARGQAEKHTSLRVGRAVVFALAKRLNRNWTADDVAKAMSPESLSLAADAYTGSLDAARKSLSSRLRSRKRGKTRARQVQHEHRPKVRRQNSAIVVGA